MQDQGNYSEYQQQVDQSACNVKHCESAKPSDQQYNEQYGPDTHYLSPLLVKCLSTLRRNYDTSDATRLSLAAVARDVITGHLVAMGRSCCMLEMIRRKIGSQPWYAVCT